MMGKFMGWLLAFALIASPAALSPVAAAPKVKYAKTEVDKARGKCVGALVGGALLGALVGRATGKNNVAEGAVVGALAGGALCATIMANAKRADRIIAAQIEAARHQDTPFVTSFASDDGTSMTTFQGLGGQDQKVDTARLRPVRYQLADGGQVASPVLEGAAQDCRTVSSSLSDAQGVGGALPQQLFCRTPDGDYKPYGYTKA